MDNHHHNNNDSNNNNDTDDEKRINDGSKINASSISSAPINQLGQDMKELFQIYHPPPPNISLLHGEVNSMTFIEQHKMNKNPLKKRCDVHRTGDWHRSIEIWVVGSDGKGGIDILLQKRSPHKDTYPNMWDVSCAGHITGYDTSKATAIKELEEEICLNIVEDDLKLLFTNIYRARGETEKFGIFEDNEYQDVYLLFYDNILSVQQQNRNTVMNVSNNNQEKKLLMRNRRWTFGEGEVSDLKCVSFQELKEMLHGSKCDEFICRFPMTYVDNLLQAISEKVPHDETKIAIQNK